MRKNINNQLSDLLNANHNIEGDSQERVVQLFELKALEDAVRATDNHRHTSDCDWVITISFEEEGVLKELPEDPDENEVSSWGILFNGEEVDVINGTLTACVDHTAITHIYAWVRDEDDQPEKKLIPVEQVKAIAFELT